MNKFKIQAIAFIGSNVLCFFLLFFIPMFSCDRSRTQEEIKNAVSLSKTLKNDEATRSPNFSRFPKNGIDENESYTVVKHVLKPGETIQDLTVLYGVDWQSIQRANAIDNFNELKPGQIVLIPVKKSSLQDN